MSSSNYKEYDPESGLEGRKGDEASERVGLLSGSQQAVVQSMPRYTLKHVLASFAGGITVCLAVQLSLFGIRYFSFRGRTGSGGVSANGVDIYAPPWVGSTTVHNYPPPYPTNDFPDVFPTEYAFPSFMCSPSLTSSFLVLLPCDSVGYPGKTPTGAEPALIATAPTQPLQTGAAQLVAPAYASLPDHPSRPSTPSDRPFNLFRSWGNLSPWYSVPRGAFGIDEGAEPPTECDIKGVHILHRHGARYPTSWGMCHILAAVDSRRRIDSLMNVDFVANYGGPASLARRLHESAEQWNATGRLAFLNDWLVVPHLYM
ncbi:hypothetical protein J3R82DRAFT_7913 [Butyriboletus roseoflavus]|nr:hypothetical protein J3R82DRAFT_7913 [Butyriboletus roseoflavus]